LTHSAKNHLRLAFVILSICLLTAAARALCWLLFGFIALHQHKQNLTLRNDMHAVFMLCAAPPIFGVNANMKTALSDK
jgi:hypothetical protein